MIRGARQASRVQRDVRGERLSVSSGWYVGRHRSPAMNPTIHTTPRHKGHLPNAVTDTYRASGQLDHEPTDQTRRSRDDKLRQLARFDRAPGPTSRPPTVLDGLAACDSTRRPRRHTLPTRQTEPDRYLTLPPPREHMRGVQLDQSNFIYRIRPRRNPSPPDRRQRAQPGPT